MISIYERALGEAYSRLHPELQKKFGLTSEARTSIICTGVMEKIWGGKVYMKPFLHLGAQKNITFSERGRNIPFTLENYAYRNAQGQECMAWIRKFQFDPVRNFDATMIYSSKKKVIVDYLGIDQDFVTDIDISVLENGGIRLLSGPLTFSKKGLNLKIPAVFSGTAEAIEWYDEENECFHIHVEVTNGSFGTVFGYKGTFTIEYVTCEDPPAYAKPRREAVVTAV